MNGPRYSSLRSFFAALASSLLLGACILASHGALARSAASSEPSKGPEVGGVEHRLTEDRLKDSDWWPTKGGVSRDDYVGATECASCHNSQFKNAKSTAMAHAATPAKNSESIRQHDPLDFRIGSYSYRISSAGGKSVLRVNKRGTSHSVDLMWAFGVGRIAQTYVYEQSGKFYESHVSFYTTLQALDVTPGHPQGVPPNLEEAAGRLMPAKETRRCFGCHTTASMTKTGLNTRSPMPGISCEACHGPGARHVAAMKSGDFDVAILSIVNPAKLSPVDSVDFCGACHRTWQDVVSDGPARTAALNVRFAPYRLENSRCWKEGKGDARITCITCHDPHQPLVTDPAAYDSACLKCHVAAGTHASEKQNNENHRTACPIGVQLCVTCHMPKFKNTGFHFTFTDHWIRTADAGAPLPD